MNKPVTIKIELSHAAIVEMMPEIKRKIMEAERDGLTPVVIHIRPVHEQKVFGLFVI